MLLTKNFEILDVLNIHIYKNMRIFTYNKIFN